MGGSVAGRMRWEREGSTDSRRTCVAPKSARMGEGVMEHKRVGVEEASSASSSSELSDSNALKGLSRVGKMRGRGERNYSREEHTSSIGKEGSGVESGE